jgi:hypothetical protein
MTTFTIDTDNNITALAAPQAAPDRLALGAMPFTSQKELAELAAQWPAARLVEVWNSFAGVAPFDHLKPVKKFTDRRTAITRIWQAIQKLAPAAQQDAQDALQAQEPSSKPKAARKGRPAAQRAHGAPPKARSAHKATAARKPAQSRHQAPHARPGSKTAKVLDLLRRSGGASLPELQKATGWLPHSVRGFLSGALRKRMGLALTSTKDHGTDRRYSLQG